MVRTSGRSKGCATCRRRKVLCDEILPECSQCLRGGRKCPGAVSGMVFLEASTSRSSSRQRSSDRERATLQESSKSELYKQDSSQNYLAVPLDSAGEMNTILSGMNNKLPKYSVYAQEEDYKANLEPYLQQDQFHRDAFSISNANSELSDIPAQMGNDNVLAEQMLSHFIGFFGKDLFTEDSERSWVYSLPQMASSESAPAIKLPVIAASYMYYGTLTNQKGAIMEAYKWYGSSLEEQRMKLQNSAQQRGIPAAEDICMPILLSFFEIICTTSPTALNHHVGAAAKLLDLRGAERCSSGIYYQLFQSVRAQMVYPAIASRTPSIFARDDWLNAPFVNRPRVSFDKIMDFLTRLPLLQCRINDDCSPRIFPSSHPGGYQVEMHANQMKTELDDLWEEIRVEASAQAPCSGQLPNRMGFDREYDTRADTTTVNTRAPLGTLTVALYNTARILLLSILSQVAPFSYFEFQEISAEMTIHSASIIDAAEFLETCDIGCALLRLMLPLRVVGVSNHNAAHSRHAVQILERWRARCGMSGICEVVLSDIQRERAASIE